MSIYYETRLKTWTVAACLLVFRLRPAGFFNGGSLQNDFSSSEE